MMRQQGVKTPLLSYSEVRVNGDLWGLYLVVEEAEEAFAKRNYGRNFAQLYKLTFKKLTDDNDDVTLIYIDDNISSYDNIFRKAKFKSKRKDKDRLINSLRVLASKDNLEDVIEINEVLKYFNVQSFVLNFDSYLGKNGHNYFLYEKDGKLSMLPWDYNLAFATYTLAKNDVNKGATYYII